MHWLTRWVLRCLGDGRGTLPGAEHGHESFLDLTVVPFLAILMSESIVKEQANGSEESKDRSQGEIPEDI